MPNAIGIVQYWPTSNYFICVPSSTMMPANKKYVTWKVEHGI